MSRPFGNKTAVLASGFGSNLQALIDAQAAGESLARIACVVSDRADSGALVRAARHGIEGILLSPRDFPDREALDTALCDRLDARGIDWVVLAGYMRILSKAFVRRYRGRILNIHPSLLPAYPGIRSIERAHADRAARTGVTVHFVDEGVDTGPIILQEAFAVDPQESLEALTQRVHALEHRLYPKALNLVLEGKVVYRERE